MPSFAARPEEILKPARPWFVALTMLFGFIGNLLPVAGYAATFKPDFLALLILYWCIQEPRMMGVGIAWFAGLFMDVADATLFGQHALAYAVLAYSADYFRRRVLRFTLWHQAAQVAVLLLFCASLVLLVRVVAGAPLPGWTYFASPLVGALVWPLLSVLLQRPQRPARSSAQR
jgi:rod shape-determining protein MreD